MARSQARQVLLAVFGGGLYVAASGLFGLALGTLRRSTGGAVTAMIAGLLVLFPGHEPAAGRVGRAVGHA